LIVEKITYSPIGVIKSPFEDVRDMPIQPTGARQVIGTVEVYPEFKGGLDSLEGFSHVILLYHFHKAASWKPMITPFLDNKPHGIFSTRCSIDHPMRIYLGGVVSPLVRCYYAVVV